MKFYNLDMILAIGYRVRSHIGLQFKNIPNADTIAAIAKVQEMKKDPNKQIYNSFDEFLKEVEE